MAIDTCQRQNATAASLLLGSANLFNAGDDTLPGGDNINPEGGIAVNLNLPPTSVVTIIVANLQAI